MKYAAQILAILFSFGQLQQVDAHPFKKEHGYIAVGGCVALLAAGVVGGMIGNYRSSSRYDYLKEQEIIKAEQAAQEKEEAKQKAFEEKIAHEHLAVERSKQFIKPFLPFIQSFQNKQPESIKNNQTYQQELTHLIMGSNAHTNRIQHINQEMWHIEQDLMRINNPDLKPEKEELLNLISWLKTHINASSHARQAQLEIERQQLILENQRNQTTITRQQAQQEEIKTKCIKKEAELREKAAQQIAQNAERLERQLSFIRSDLEDQANTLRRSIQEKLSELNNWQAKQSSERAEVRRMLNTLENEYKQLEAMLNQFESTNNTFKHFAASIKQQLDAIANNQHNQTALLIEQIRSIFDAYFNQSKQQKVVYPQPSAPPMGPEDELA